jgi:tetratricopeptide (TPR) repeat protein
MARHSRSRVCVLLFGVAGSAFLGITISALAQNAAKTESGRNWPDAAEINQMFNTGPETAAQRHARAAVAAAQAKDFQRAIREWNQVIQLAPDFSSAFYYRAAAYEELGDRAKAIADADEFVRLRPNVAAGWTQRGIIYADGGEFRSGLRDCNRALQIDP